MKYTLSHSWRQLPLLLSLFLLLETNLIAASENAPCYDPSGAVAPGYYPCDPTAYITNCCAAGWTCFSNAKCVVTTPTDSYPNLALGAVGRAMCTNPEWNNHICGDFCITRANSDNDGDMVACGSNRFCCAGDYAAGTCSCGDGEGNGTTTGGSFVVSDGLAQTIVGVATATFTGVTPSYLTSRPTVSSTVSSSSLSSASSFASGSYLPSASATPTGPASNGTLPSPSPSRKNTVAIGAGVGVGVGVPLLLILAGLFWCMRQRCGRSRMPVGLALDGTAFGEQMARQSHGLGRSFRLRRRGSSFGSSLHYAGPPPGGPVLPNGDGGRINLQQMLQVPTPPPPVRADA